MLDGTQFKADDQLPMEMLFDYDMAMAMIEVGQGYDPFNHVGDRVVAECIGVHIGPPTFAEG